MQTLPKDPFVLVSHKRKQRLIAIDMALRSKRGMTISEMEDTFNCSRRLIEFDLTWLKTNCNAEIILQPGFPHRWRYGKTSLEQESPFLSEEDLFLLLLGGQALQQYKGTPFEKRVKSAFKKTVNSVRKSNSGNTILDSTALVHFDAGTITTIYNPIIFSTLLACLNEKESVTISYYTAHSQESSDRKIRPYAIACIDGEWYVIGWDQPNNEVRTFHISRISAATPAEEYYTIPKSFSFRKYIAQGFNLIKGENDSEISLLFEKEAVPYVQEKQWHTSQKFTPQENGRLLMRFKTSGLEAIKRWVLGFGKNVTVIEPAELRDMVMKETILIHEKYTMENGSGLTG